MHYIQLSKGKIICILVGIFLIGLVLRLLYFDKITITYDQARDALESMKIWTSDPFKLRGPATDIPGITHGPLYWYLISPFYYFSSGNVYVVKVLLILLNLMGIGIIYWIAKDVFKNKLVGLVSASIYAVSFEVIQYAKWLSNPSPAVITIPLSYFGLWMIYTKRNIGYILFFVSWALSVHFQFFLTYQILLFIALLIYQVIRAKKDIGWTYLIAGVVCAVIILSPFIVAEIKFDFSGIRAIVGFLSEPKPLVRSFTEILFLYIDKIALAFYYSVFGLNLAGAGLIMLMMFIGVSYEVINSKRWVREMVFLVIWLLSPFILASFEKNNFYFLIIGTVYPVILLTSYFLVKIWSTKYRAYAVLFFVLLILGNLKLITTYNKTGEPLFSVQMMLYGDEKTVIDWIYNDAGGKEFGINTVTNPLFINTTWAFLFDGYARRTYHYMPVWLGYQQDGNYGAEVKFNGIIPKIGMSYYLIIEPPRGIPDTYIKGIPDYENNRSYLVYSKDFGEIRVEKRIITKDKYFSRDDLYKVITTKKY